MTALIPLATINGGVQREDLSWKSVKFARTPLGWKTAVSNHVWWVNRQAEVEICSAAITRSLMESATWKSRAFG
jgi:hypothetical protein